MPFAMPESYRAYYTDTAVRTAVDHILASTGKWALRLPSDIDWEDLPAFHRAVLSAHQVRSEFSVFLIDLWNAVWQRALAECGFHSGRVDWTVSQTEEWSAAQLDTHSVWDNGWFGRVFAIGGGNLQFGLAVHVLPEGAKLGLSFWGADDTDHTTRTNFGEGWREHEIEEGWIYAGEDLAPIRDDGTIDLEPLHKAAADALAAIGNHAQG